MTDLHTRRLRYFVAVAEELHFSRAAARLFIVQQALSKQIRELEEEIGVQLLRRTTRHVELTPAGTAFLATCRDILARLDEGLTEVRQVSRADRRTLRLGFSVGAALELTAPIFAAFAERHPDVELQAQEYGLNVPSAGLLDGSSDVALLRLPVHLPGGELVPLFDEPVVAGLVATHPLAARDRLRVDDLRGEVIALGSNDDRIWRDYWSLGATADPARRDRIIATSSQTEELGFVGAGMACSIAPAAAVRFLGHPTVVYRPIVDHPPSRVAVGWLPGPNAELARLFADTARTVRDRCTELVELIEHPPIGTGGDTA